MTTIISRAFRFSECESITIPSSNESTWSLVRRDIWTAHDHTPKNRWIYVFQLYEGKVQLYKELYLDHAHTVSVYPGRDARLLERDERPEPTPTGDFDCTLPHTINDNRAYYFFILSRIRLPRGSILALEHDMPSGTGGPIDLATKEAFIEYRPTTGGLPCDYVTVIDPMTIAIKLHEIYESRCDHLLDYCVEHAGQSKSERASVRRRHNEFLMAQLLKSTFESDPQDKLGLDAKFKGGRARIHRVIEEYRAELRDRTLACATAAEPLVFFKRGTLLRAIEESYRIFELEDYAKWLEFLSEIMERMSESPIGKAHIGALLTHPDYAFGAYLLRTTVAPKTQFSVFKQATSAVTNLWREAIFGMVTSSPSGAKRAADALNFISNLELLRVTERQVDLDIQSNTGMIRTERAAVGELQLVDSAEVKAWAKDGAIGTALRDVSLALDVANLALALIAVGAAEPDERVAPIVKLVGSALSNVSGVMQLLKLPVKVAKGAGGLAASLGAILAARDGLNAYKIGDTNSAIGYGIIATGSALTAAGCFCAVAGAATATTGVGIPLGALLGTTGAILGTAGWVVVVFGGDSEVQQFATNCRWGLNYPSSSTDTRAKWVVGGSFSGWADPESGAERQALSLLNLLAAFVVAPVDPVGIRIQCGMTSAATKIVIKMRTVYRRSYAQPGGPVQPGGPTRNHDAEIIFDLRKRKQILGDMQDPSSFAVADDLGRPCLTYISRVAQPGETVESCAASVKLLLDDQSDIPAGKFVELRVSSFGGLGLEASSLQT